MNDVLKNLKILVVTTVPETIRAFLLPQLADLRDKGCELHIAIGIGCDLPELEALGITEHRLPLTRDFSPVQDLKALWSMLWLCLRWRFNLVHTHTLKASLIGQIAGWLASVPVRLETAHGTRYMPDLPFTTRKGYYLVRASSCLAGTTGLGLKQGRFGIIQNPAFGKGQCA
jgi:hypothetical protein